MTVNLSSVKWNACRGWGVRLTLLGAPGEQKRVDDSKREQEKAGGSSVLAD